MRLREIFESTVLVESATEILYHYSTPRSAVKTLSAGAFQLASSLGDPIETSFAPKGWPFFLSLSRSKLGEFHATKSDRSGVLYVLDGRSLAHNHKIKPMDYFAGIWKTDPMRQPEAEDRLFSRESTLPITHVREIHVFQHPYNAMRGDQLEQIVTLADAHAIPIYVYDDWNSWLTQFKRRALSRDAIEKMFGGAKPVPSRERAQDSYYGDTLEHWIELITQSDPKRLSKKASDIQSDMIGYGQYYVNNDYGLARALANARKANTPEYPLVVKIFGIMRKNGLHTVQDLRQWIVDRWLKIDQG
jgi:hypothetical protein